MDAILAIILLSLALFSSEKEEPADHIQNQAVYEVRSEVFPRGEPPIVYERTETWTISGTFGTDEDPDYARDISVTADEPRTVTIIKEAENFFGRRVVNPRTRLEYSWMRHPNSLAHGEKTIGHREERGKIDGQLRARSPLFVSVRAITDSLYTTTMTVYGAGGSLSTLKETYTRSHYHLPLERIEELVDGTGRVVSRVTTKRMH